MRFRVPKAVSRTEELFPIATNPLWLGELDCQAACPIFDSRGAGVFPEEDAGTFRSLRLRQRLVSRVARVGKEIHERLNQSFRGTVGSVVASVGHDESLAMRKHVHQSVAGLVEVG